MGSRECHHVHGICDISLQLRKGIGLLLGMIGGDVPRRGDICFGIRLYICEWSHKRLLGGSMIW